jgi:hypothetical protein
VRRELKGPTDEPTRVGLGELEPGLELEGERVRAISGAIAGGRMPP